MKVASAPWRFSPLPSTSRALGVLCGFLFLLLFGHCERRSAVTLPTAEPRDDQGLGEDWQWQRATLRDGTLRIEREHWHLESLESPGPVEGWMSRDVSFISVDGTPFQCIQGLSYTLSAQYTLAGQRTAQGLVFKGVDVDTAPGPCEPGVRPLPSYRARPMAAATLEVQWKGDTQLLLPAKVRARAAFTATSLAGRWHWDNQQSTPSRRVRREDEDWQLKVSKSGEITGSYVRRVHLRDSEGKPIPCAKAPFYQYTDTYEVVGRIENSTLKLRESAVQATAHPCTGGQKRTLDSASGAIYGDAMRLEWRGRRTQILRPSGL